MIVNFDDLRMELTRSYNSLVRKLNGHHAKDMFGAQIEINPEDISAELMDIKQHITILLALQLPDAGITSLLDEVTIEKFDPK